MRLSIERSFSGQAIDAGERVEVVVDPTGPEWSIEVDAPFHDDPPPAKPAGTCSGLFRHEVVECFLVGDGERYLEVELGPHGHYLLLALEGARNIIEQGMSAPYEVSIDRPQRRWRARMTLTPDLLPLPIRRVNAFSIHGLGQARRHLCFHPLPGARPDFHQIAVFPAFETSAGSA